MKSDLGLIEALIWRGWEIRWSAISHCFEFLEPSGSSGTDYQTKTIAVLPPAVEEWVQLNLPMTPR